MVFPYSESLLFRNHSVKHDLKKEETSMKIAKHLDINKTNYRVKQKTHRLKLTS